MVERGGGVYEIVPPERIREKAATNLIIEYLEGVTAEEASAAEKERGSFGSVVKDFMVLLIQLQRDSDLREPRRFLRKLGLTRKRRFNLRFRRLHLRVHRFKLLPADRQLRLHAV